MSGPWGCRTGLQRGCNGGMRRVLRGNLPESNIFLSECLPERFDSGFWKAGNVRGDEMTLKTMKLAALLALLSGCATGEKLDLGFDNLFSTKSQPATGHAMRWDHVPASDGWTEATLAALDSHGQNLVNTMPADIAQWCPGYARADVEGRKAFWTGLLATLAKHESTWQPKVVGGGGRWFGLVQIAPATARGYGCAARSGEALKDGAANLSCAVRILDTTVPRDNVVSAGMRGVAADWGPFHQQSKREDMRNWMLSQPYCTG